MGLHRRSGALNGLRNAAASQGNYEDAVEFARQRDAVYEKVASIISMAIPFEPFECGFPQL